MKTELRLCSRWMISTEQNAAPSYYSKIHKSMPKTVKRHHGLCTYPMSDQWMTGRHGQKKKTTKMHNVQLDPSFHLSPVSGSLLYSLTYLSAHRFSHIHDMCTSQHDGRQYYISPRIGEKKIEGWVDCFRAA